jgi:hypothetical protein
MVVSFNSDAPSPKKTKDEKSCRASEHHTSEMRSITLMVVPYIP